MAMIDGCCLYIERVNRDVFPPAVAEVHLSTSERLPIFDEHEARDAEIARRLHVPCYIQTGRSERDTIYVRHVHMIDVDAESQRCYRCGSWTEKRIEKRFFECLRCHALMLFEPAPRYVPERPTKARASIGQWTDVLFALDDRDRLAYLIDVIPGETPRAGNALAASAEIHLLTPIQRLGDLHHLPLRIMQNNNVFVIIADAHVIKTLPDLAKLRAEAR